MERFRMQFVKKVQFEKLYVLICLRPRSENVAIPHPPLRGTFPPGEGILQFHDQLIKADNLNSILSVHCGKLLCTIIIYNFCLYFPAIQDYNAVRKMPCRAGAVPEHAGQK